MNDPLWKIVRILPTDYTDYVGKVERWKYSEEHYPDCSSGCRHYRRLHSEHQGIEDADWGVCTNHLGPRAGLLTWEHQAGFGCWEQ